MKKKKILLFGYYGTGNLGDNALVYSIVNKLIQVPNFYVNVLSDNEAELDLPNNNKVTKWDYPLKSKSIFLKTYKLLIHLYKNNVFAFGGGGKVNLESVAQMKAIYKKIILARLFGNDIWFLNIGVEGKATDSSKKILREIIKRTEIFSVRDNHSLQLLKICLKDEYNKYKEKIHLTSDAAFGLDLNALLEDNKKLDEKDMFTLGVIPVYKFDNENRLSDILTKMLCNFDNLRIKFIPFHKNDDEKEIERIIQEIDINKFGHDRVIVENWTHDYGKVMRTIDNCDAIISMRLHGCIFSYIVNKPLIAIGKSEHLKGFIREAKYPDFVLKDIVSESDPEAYYKLINKKEEFVSSVEVNYFSDLFHNFYEKLININEN